MSNKTGEMEKIVESMDETVGGGQTALVTIEDASPDAPVDATDVMHALGDAGAEGESEAGGPQHGRGRGVAIGIAAVGLCVAFGVAAWQTPGTSSSEADPGSLGVAQVVVAADAVVGKDDAPTMPVGAGSETETAEEGTAMTGAEADRHAGVDVVGSAHPQGASGTSADGNSGGDASSGPGNLIGQGQHVEATGGGTGQQQSQPVQETHSPVWVVDQAAWDEQVLMSEAWDEPVYSQRELSICNTCGADITSDPWGHIDAVHESIGGYHSGVESYQSGTVHHDATYQTVHHDEAGHWE